MIDNILWLSWKYVNKAEIITKVTMMLSLTRIKNKDFDFVGGVIRNPRLFYFLGVKSTMLKKNTQDVWSLLALVKSVVASQKKRQRKKFLSRFVDNWKHRLGLGSALATLCEWATSTRQTCFSKTFANSPKRQQPIERLNGRLNKINLMPDISVTHDQLRNLSPTAESWVGSPFRWLRAVSLFLRNTWEGTQNK